jgi:hypothetical protein
MIHETATGKLGSGPYARPREKAHDQSRRRSIIAHDFGAK